VGKVNEFSAGDLQEASPRVSGATPVSAGTAAITVPAEFLSAGTVYAFEVLAICGVWNQTTTESCLVPQ